MAVIRSAPETCVPGDLVTAELVKDWPAMTNKSAVAFRSWTGKRLNPETQLVRKGDLIFEVVDSVYARCLYRHSRQF